MNAKYEIRVIRQHGNCTHQLFVYTGATHPVPADRIEYADESYLVNGVRHVLKSGRDGSGTWYTLDYVEVKVY